MGLVTHLLFGDPRAVWGRLVVCSEILQQRGEKVLLVDDDPGRCGASRRLQGLVDVGDDILRMLDADGEPHIAVGDASPMLLLARQLRMRGGRGMDRQRPDIADIGDVVDHLEIVDERAAGVPPALELETDQRAVGHATGASL